MKTRLSIKRSTNCKRTRIAAQRRCCHLTRPKLVNPIISQEKMVLVSGTAFRSPTVSVEGLIVNLALTWLKSLEPRNCLVGSVQCGQVE